MHKLVLIAKKSERRVLKMRMRIAVLAISIFLFGVIFSAIPVKGVNPTIKVGVIGPQGLPHWSPAGMKEAAEMARNEINAAGGINVGGTMYDFELLYGNEYAVPTPDPAAAQLEVTNLVSAGAKFLIGGFRTEVTGPMIETAMDLQTPFFIDGASTDELIRDLSIPANYTRYKYLFRVTPINSTALFKTIVAFLGGYLIPNQLLPIYGHTLYDDKKQVRVAVLTEDLAWTLKMHAYLTNPAIYPAVLGPYANVTYSARIPATAMDVSSYLTQVIASQARLLIFVFSGATGLPFIMQWKAMNVSAIPVGINVFGQVGTHWNSTSGACQWETILDTTGTRTPINSPYTETFWDDFLAYTRNLYGTASWPIYTAFGAYDSMYAIKQALETADTLDVDTLIPTFEGMVRTDATLGTFQWTANHDVYITNTELGPHASGRTRAEMIQWVAGRKEVVWPIDASYSRMVRLPTQMYPLLTDLTGSTPWTPDGKVDIRDIAAAAKAFGSYYGSPTWNYVCDINNDGKVDIKDLAAIAKDFGKVIALPLP